MFQRSIRQNLFLLSNVGVVGLLAFAALSFFTVSQIQVGSDFFAQKRLSNSVAADFENPPQSLQKVYSLAVEAEDAATPEARQALIARIRAARQDYESGHAHYAQALPPGPLRDLVMGEGQSATEAWYEAAERSFIPAVEAGDRVAAERARLGPMEDAYRRDAAAVDQITALTDAWDEANDQAARHLVKVRMTQMGAAAAFLLLAMVLLGRRIVRQMTRGIDGILGHLEALAACDLGENIEISGPEEFARMLGALDKSVRGFREAVHSIRRGVGQITAAASEMETVTRESAAQAQKNSLQAQLAASSIAEMDSAIAEVSSHIGSAVEIARRTETSANDGHEVVGEATAAVRGIASATSQAEERIALLGADSERIGRIVTAIEEIAAQTNLLALNAAIEAARAGEFGRGFGVVAGEVRQLAERTTTATSEVSQMVGAIQQGTKVTIEAMHAGARHVENGVGKTEAAGNVLEGIRSLARESGERIEQIAVSTQEQSSAVREIHSNIDSLANFVEHTSHGAEQTAGACHSLAQMAAELAVQTSRFRMPEDGQARKVAA